MKKKSREKRRKYEVSYGSKKFPKKKLKARPAHYKVKSRHSLLALYEYRAFEWSDVEICRRMIKIKDNYRFPLPIAKPEWNKHKDRYQAYSKNLYCFLNQNNAGGLMAITNLDVILGVSLDILSPTKNSRVTISEVTKASLEERLLAQKPEHYREIRYLVSRQNDLVSILEVKEKVITSSTHENRKTFVFTIQSNRKGYFLLESLDSHTATHIFSYPAADPVAFYITKARIREYFQSVEYNKRSKLYNDDEMKKRSIDRIGSVNHTDFDGWKYRLEDVM